MTREQIVANVRERFPHMTEAMVEAALEKLLRLGLLDRFPRSLPLTREAEAALLEEMEKAHPEYTADQVQQMIDRMADAGILVRQP